MHAAVQISSSRATVFVLSPLLVIAVAQALALGLGPQLGKWVWAAIVLVYWVMLLVISLAWGGMRTIRGYLQPSTREWGWKVIAVVFGLVTLPLSFIPYHKVIFSGFEIWFSSLILALINPWIEEIYWRGVLQEATGTWPKWLSIGYSSLLFTLFHTAFSWNSVMCRNPLFFSNVLVAGILFAVIAWRLRSLRWSIFSHFLVNVFGLSTPAFLDLMLTGK